MMKSQPLQNRNGYVAQNANQIICRLQWRQQPLQEQQEMVILPQKVVQVPCCLDPGDGFLGRWDSGKEQQIETQNRNYWICNDCGYKFRNTEDWHEEIKKKEQAVKVNLVLTIFFIIVAMLLFTGGEVSSVVGIVFLIIGAVNAITSFLGKTRIRNELQHLDDLGSSSME